MTARPTRRRSGAIIAVGLVGLVAVVLAAVAWLNVRGEAPLEPDATPAVAVSADLVARGAYLARAGNCIGGHAGGPGGSDLSGGNGIETPFGTVHASNLTPDAATGIGTWTRSEFRRALRHGRSKDGRLLYPAFPYPSYTFVTADDADALHAYLRSLPAVRKDNRPHALRFPFSTQAALAVWRALFFAPGTPQADPRQDAEWNRGRYLVQALGHCAACHSGRNAWGAASATHEFAGGLMPSGGWYAPSLAAPDEAGVQDWPRAEVVRLLKTGVSERASVTGPMAEVVHASTQHLSEADLGAMARFLASIPRQPKDAPARAPAGSDTLTLGASVYERSCAACHGADGRGVRGIYPALAGNRTVTHTLPNNVVQTIRHGGFPPTTPGNPRPFGMPPFGQALDAAELSAVATYIRQSWGNGAPPVTALDVQQVR
jgi:mono/diheme cytochrome c family protein